MHEYILGCSFIVTKKCGTGDNEIVTGMKESFNKFYLSLIKTLFQEYQATYDPIAMQKESYK